MSNYFRITAWHKTKNFSFIGDSNGKFEQLWQFSSLLVKNGFKIVEVSQEGSFDFGNMPKAAEDNHILIRACAKGKAVIYKNKVTINKKSYNIIKL